MDSEHASTSEVSCSPTLSLEYETMCKLCPQLVSLVEKSPGSICDAMISKGFLSSEERNFIRMDSILPSDKARKLVDTMTDRVNHDPIAFHGFIKILETEGQWTDHVVKELHAGCSLASQEEQPPLPTSPLQENSSLDIDEQTRANFEGRLLRDTEKIDDDFNTFVSDFKNSLKANQVDPIDIAEDLLMVKAITKQLQSDIDVPELFHRIRKDLMSAESIGKLMYHIAPFVSFFNYNVIERIVHRHGSDTDKENFEDYLKKFEEFCKHRANDVPMNVDCQDPKSTCFKVKIESDFQSTYTVKAVNLFREKLCNILGVTEPSLRLLSLKEGCVLLTFLIPTFVVPFVFPLTQDQERALSAEGVTKYALADEPFHMIDDVDAKIRHYKMAESSIEPSEVPFKEKLQDMSIEASPPTIPHSTKSETSGETLVGKNKEESAARDGIKEIRQQTSPVDDAGTIRPRSLSCPCNSDTTFEFPGQKAVIQDLQASFKRPCVYTEIQRTGNTSSNQGVQSESGHLQFQTQTSGFTQHSTTSENSPFSQTKSDSHTEPVSAEGEGVVDGNGGSVLIPIPPSGQSPADSSHSPHSRDQDCSSKIPGTGGHKSLPVDPHTGRSAESTQVLRLNSQPSNSSEDSDRVVGLEDSFPIHLMTGEQKPSDSILANLRDENDRLRREIEEKDKMIALSSALSEEFFRSGEDTTSGSLPDFPSGPDSHGPGTPVLTGSRLLRQHEQKLHKKIDELKAHLAVKRTEIDTLMDQNASKESMIDVLKKTIEKNKTTSKRGIRGTDADDCLDQVMKLTSQISDMEETDKLQRQQITELEQQHSTFENLSRMARRLFEENKQLKSQVQALEGELAEEKTWQASQTSKPFSPREVDTRALSIEAQKVPQLEAKVKELQGKLKVAEGNQQAVEDADVRVMEKVTEDLGDSRRKVTQLTSGIERQQTEGQQVSRQRDEVLGELEAHILTAQTFQEDFEAERKSHSRLQEKVGGLEADVARLSTERNDCLDEIKELEQLLHECHEKPAAQQVNLQWELEDPGDEVFQLTSEMDTQQVEILHLIEQRDEVYKELGTHKTILKEKEDALSSLEEKTKVTLSQAQRIQHDLDFKLKLIQAQLPQRQPVSPVYNERNLDRYVVRPRRPIKYDKKIGEGCYCSIYAINLDGTPCIAKRLLDILMGRNQEEFVSQETKENFHRNFFRECVLLSQINHPNIVKFIGVHYGQDKYDLALILEQLATDLQKFLTKGANIPLSTKISILHDVSCGLLHLHERSIIHLDLSADNILLTTDSRAKIAGFGVSIIFDRRTSQLSKVPGTLGYMPPEALQDVSNYDESLDVFSCGVLALYVAIQEFPVFSWARVPDAIIAKGEGEIYKRRSWIDKMNTKQPELSSLVLWCLQDDPVKRPSTICLNILLNEMKKDYPFLM